MTEPLAIVVIVQKLNDKQASEVELFLNVIACELGKGEHRSQTVLLYPEFRDVAE